MTFPAMTGTYAQRQTTAKMVSVWELHLPAIITVSTAMVVAAVYIRVMELFQTIVLVK